MKSLNLNLQRVELLIIASIIMSGVGMFYTSQVVEPVKQIALDDKVSGEERSQQLKILTNLSSQLIQISEQLYIQNENIIKIQEYEGNVSQGVRTKIISDLQTILPALNNMTIEIKTMIKDMIENPPSDREGQARAIANIEHIIKTVDNIAVKLNATNSTAQ